MKASDNPFTSILVTEGTEPAAPAAGKQRLYIDSTTHKLKRTDSSGTDVTIEGGAVATDTIWDAAGDIVVGTGADTAAKLAAGTNGRVLELVGGTPAWRGPQIYQNKPAGNITRASTAVGAFSTAWQITGVVVASGQNVRLHVCAYNQSSVAADKLFCIKRGATQIATGNLTNIGQIGQAFNLLWVDENPGAGTYTYEVQAAMFSGTLTVYQTNPTTDVTGGTSIFVAEVYTP